MTDSIRENKMEKIVALGKNWYKNSHGYWDSHSKNKYRTLHQYVWFLNYGEVPEGYNIDHIDGNRDNFHISNLRLLTPQQNSLNKKATKVSSDYKGVSAVKYPTKSSQGKNWKTRVVLSNGLIKSTVYGDRAFFTELEAARYYDYIFLHIVPESITKEHNLPGNVAGRFIPILNFEYIDQQPIHSARLISVTRPTEEIAKELGVDSAEGLLAYVARVSNLSNQSNENISKLIAYCCKNKHFSVLETITFTVEITTTKDVSSQILRHNSLRFQEFSYRYANSTYLKNPYEIPELRIQNTKDRQKSITVDDNRFDDLNEKVKRHLEETYNLYNVLLDNGVAKECARRIMPVSMVTRLYASGNIRDFAFYIKARGRKEGKAQLEHQKVADSIEAIFKEQFPIVYEALFNN